MKVEFRRVTAPSPGAQDARRAWPERESLLVRLTDAEGRQGVGEASPLPGYSRDQLVEVETALRAVSVELVAGALAHTPVRAVLRAIGSLVPETLPSARMALETAALDLLGQRLQKSAPLLLGASPSARRPLSALVGPAGSPNVSDAANRALKAGFRHFKLKLGGRAGLRAELDAIARLRTRIGPEMGLRLDANGQLTAEEIQTTWQNVSHLGIELFEEPGPASEKLPSTLPLGLDESLQGLDELQAEDLLRRRHATCLVLKPMALGGLDHCWRLAERAHSAGAGAIISHCFDGPFAWRAMAALALALPGGRAHGLSPHAGLGAQDTATLPVSHGELEVWERPGLGASRGQGFE